MRIRRPRRSWTAWPAAAALAAVGYWAMASSYSQVLGHFPFRGPRDRRVVALTFDDGPNEPFTSDIGDFLAAEGIRATFFQVARCVERHPGVTARLVRQGHVIGNHSQTHQITRCLGPRAQQTQTRNAQLILTGAIGRVPALYRPPWLLRTPTLAGVLRRNRLHPVSGEFCHAFEVFQPSPVRIARRALAKAKPGAVLIFHDGFDGRGGDRASTAAAVRLVVAGLRRRGYGFLTVDELLGIPAYGEPNLPATA